MGNHERKHVRGSRHEVKLARSQQISRIQFGDSYADALAFMESLPLYLELPEAVIVHGYFEPGVPLEQQRSSVLCGTMGGESYLRDHYEQVWYELYDGSKPLLVGHENYTGTDQPFVYKDRVFGLDTDCVHGKALTGVLLPAFRFVSVPSRANHWMQVRRMYPKPEKKSQPVRVFVERDEDEKLVLAHLIEQIYQRCQSILQQLQTEEDYTNLSARKQALRFGEQAGKGMVSTLMHLARVAKLDTLTAQKIIKTPESLNHLLQETDELKDS
jgi:hypothetical protein